MNEKIDGLFTKPLFNSSAFTNKKLKTRKKIIYSFIITSSVVIICLPLINIFVHFHNKRLFEESQRIGNSKPYDHFPYYFLIAPIGTYSDNKDVTYKIYIQFSPKEFESYRFKNFYMYYSIAFSNEKRRYDNAQFTIPKGIRHTNSKPVWEEIYPSEFVPFDNEYLFASYYINKRFYNKYKVRYSYETIPFALSKKYKYLYNRYTTKVNIPIDLFKKYANSFKYFHILWYFNKEVRLFTDKKDGDTSLQCFYCTTMEYTLDNNLLRTDYGPFDAKRETIKTTE